MIRYFCLIVCLLFFACTSSESSSTDESGDSLKVRILKGEKTDYRLNWSVQILKDTLPGYTIQEITEAAVQDKFIPYLEYSTPFETHQSYWGKLQVENRLTDADQYAEWVFSFTSTWTTLDVFLQNKDGSWRLEKSGSFVPDAQKTFVPTAKGNLVKLILPPDEVVTLYFRGKSERTAIYPSFYVRLKHIDTYYDELLKDKAGNAIFMGFLLMMFFYNLIVYFFGRDGSFIFYSAYLFMVVVYAAFSSEDLVDWLGLFSDHPDYLRFAKLSMYLAMMAYLSFIRSFLDLKQLLPRWDTVLKVVIYLGFPAILLDIVVLLLTNFSYVIEDRVTVPYILLVIIVCCALVYPLLRTKDIKGYFIIAGIATITLGAFVTVLTLVLLPPFSIFYLKAGTVIEVIIFSLGLAYRQRQQQVAKQQADFQLKESQLLQEKKELEANRLKELNDFKTRFYTNITHEFRTPLTVIMGISENIKQHEEEKNLIRRNSENLLRLINQLLDLSKLESGKLALQKVHRDIIMYLQYLTESFYSTATKKNIRLLFHSEEEKVMMDYDEDKIQQIVYNLLSNALKYTPEYGKVILYASQVKQDNQSLLKLKVKDSGMGIPPESIGFIFDQFYQVQQTDIPDGNSSGIGLALTKELIELMNGSISVQSEEGKGTEFTVLLPIEAKLEPEAGMPEDIDMPTDSETLVTKDDVLEQKLKSQISSLPQLLIIEDNPDIVTYIETIVKDRYGIYTARNGALGIEKAVEKIPDIIISDVMMPEKSGYEVCKTLKQDPRTSHIPIILLTAKSTQADKVEGLKYGADAYLAKPFDKEELIIRLEKLVETHRRLQQFYAGTNDSPQTTVASVDEIFLQDLREQIEIYLNDPEFGVTRLAESVSMNQMQVYRKLKALTGKTPSQFIRSHRLRKGLELLHKGELNISQVAYETGFADPSYFSRVFQQEFGKSPSDFLK